MMDSDKFLMNSQAEGSRLFHQASEYAFSLIQHEINRPSHPVGG